jgi:hypothetical protein
MDDKQRRLKPEIHPFPTGTAPNEQVNQLVQKFALSRLLDYQKEGTRTLGEVYNDKGQKVNVADQFKYMLPYYQKKQFRPASRAEDSKP